MDDVVLRHVAEHAAEGPKLACRSTPSKCTDPEVAGARPAIDFQQRGLARAARPDDRDQLTRPERERDGVEQGELARVAEPDPPGELVDVDAHAERWDGRRAWRRRRRLASGHCRHGRLLVVFGSQ